MAKNPTAGPDDRSAQACADAARGPRPSEAAERRAEGADRRARVWYALLYGGFKPRRRAGRRAEDQQRAIVDWHDPALLASAVLTLILCVLDAGLTLRLLASGAHEANPVMALLVYGDARRFVILKLALTAFGVMALVVLARVRVFRWLRVGALVHSTLVAYLLLISYELSLAGELN
jgi:hypothetical protein